MKQNKVSGIEDLTGADSGRSTRVPRVFLVGLAAVLVYVLVAGGAANLLTAWFSTDSDLADFALG
ncbi:hypothetical protein, partial [Agromyces salentinus]